MADRSLPWWVSDLLFVAFVVALMMFVVYVATP